MRCWRCGSCRSLPEARPLPSPEDSGRAYTAVVRYIHERRKGSRLDCGRARVYMPPGGTPDPSRLVPPHPLLVAHAPTHTPTHTCT